MTSAAVVVSNFGSDHWDADVYGVMSMASRLAGLVKTRAQTIRLGYNLWQLHSLLGDFFKLVRENAEGQRQAAREEVTPERVTEMIRTLRLMYFKLEALYEAARRARLTNNSILAMPLRSIHTYSDDVLELAELLEAYQNKEGIDAIFDRAAGEKARGEIYDLAEIER